eukprot:358478-Chlamydomonas_euryale.AAC.15
MEGGMSRLRVKRPNGLTAQTRGFPGCGFKECPKVEDWTAQTCPARVLPSACMLRVWARASFACESGSRCTTVRGVARASWRCAVDA